MLLKAITSYLADAVSDEANGKIGLFYWDKKRAIALLSQKKVTMPNTVNTWSDGSLHSIHEKGSPVKPKLKNITESQQFKNLIGEALSHQRKDDIVEFARGNIVYRVGQNGYVADVLVGIRKNGAAVLYDIVNIYDKKIVEVSVAMANQNDSQRRQKTSTKRSISQKFKKVNRKRERN